MVDRLKVTAEDFDAKADLPQWRVLLGKIEASFSAGSFTRAAQLVTQVAELAEAADHHPEVDLRYPDVVHITLSTHVAHGLTTADVDLARAISATAAASGSKPAPAPLTRVEMAIDAIDIDAVLPFWRAVLGYVDDQEPGGTPALVDPLGIGPALWFQQMDAPRPQRNRMHLDVTVAHDEAARRIDAALAAGGTLVSDHAARAFWILADVEGNEACVCTWQDRLPSSP